MATFLADCDGLFYAAAHLCHLRLHHRRHGCDQRQKALLGGRLSRHLPQVLIFILVGIANVIDINVLGQVGVLRTAVIFFYISNEGLSLIENAAHLGLPIPGKLKEVLEAAA